MRVWMWVRLGFDVAAFTGLIAGTVLGHGALVAVSAGLVGGVLLTRLADAIGDRRVKERLWMACLAAAGAAYFTRSLCWFYAAWSALFVTIVYRGRVIDEQTRDASRG